MNNPKITRSKRKKQKGQECVADNKYSFPLAYLGPKNKRIHKNPGSPVNSDEAG